MMQRPLLVAKMTMGAILDSRARWRKVKHSMSSMCTSSMKRTPGTSSAMPWSMYLSTTLLISKRSFSVGVADWGDLVTPQKLILSLHLCVCLILPNIFMVHLLYFISIITQRSRKEKRRHFPLSLSCRLDVRKKILMITIQQKPGK